jgi:hypothetical protein
MFFKDVAKAGAEDSPTLPLPHGDTIPLERLFPVLSACDLARCLWSPKMETHSVLGQRCGVAVLTAVADFGATHPRVEGVVGPSDQRAFHFGTPFSCIAIHEEGTPFAHRSIVAPTEDYRHSSWRAREKVQKSLGKAPICQSSLCIYVAI